MSDESQPTTPVASSGSQPPPASVAAPIGQPAPHTGPNPVVTPPPTLKKHLDWHTKYKDPVAARQIHVEAWYCACCGIAYAVATAGIWCASRGWAPVHCLQVVELGAYKDFMRFAFAWLGGALGSTLFVSKWLIYAVIIGQWQMDRRYWRLFTPHIGGATGFAFVVVIGCGLFSILNKQSVDSPLACWAIGFMVGYFTDRAMLKLGEVAEVLFGKAKPAQFQAGGGPAPGAAAKQDDGDGPPGQE